MTSVPSDNGNCANGPRDAVAHQKAHVVGKEELERR